jgi:hypothetical protein
MTRHTPSAINHLEQFANHLIASGKSPHTIEAYGRDVRLFSE